MPLPFRTKQFSSGISAQFKPDIVQIYGETDPINCTYFDPVQSLYITGTTSGKVHVYGKSGSKRKFSLEAPDNIRVVRLVKTVFLVAIDSSNKITVWDLESNEKWAQYHIPSPMVSCYLDPALDWLFIGQKNGQTSVYDIDRGIISQFLVDNIQLQIIPAARLGGVLSVQLHPRDITQILLCYSDMFAVFSVATNTIQFHAKAKEKLLFAKWNPSGTHIMTGSENSLGFWDGYSGRFLVQRPSFHTTEPIWCSTENTEETFIVYGAGAKVGLVRFGITPTYAVTSWDAFGKFLGTAKEHVVVFDHDVAEITPMSQTPFYGGGHNPQAFVVRLANQSMHTFKPNLSPTIACAVLPEDLCFSANTITCIEVASSARLKWSGMMFSSPRPLIRGGSVHTTTCRLANTSVVLCGYVDGSVRLFSESTKEDTRVLETSVAEAAPGPVTKISLSGDSSELAVAVFSGTVVLLGFQRNNLGIDGLSLNNPEIKNVAHTANSDLKEGYFPLWSIAARGEETVTALCQSEIGFVGIGYSSSRIAIVDKRGPAFILDENLPSSATFIAFGIQEFQQDGYSSILMSVGTANGQVFLYKIVPRDAGGFQAFQAADFVVGNDPVTLLVHMDLANGRESAASREVMSQLARGIRIQGGLLASNSEDARMFGITGTKPKLAHKRLDRSIGTGFACLREGDALGLITISQKPKLHAYGIPELSSLFSYDLPLKAVGSCKISSSGNLLVPTGEKTAGLVRIWGVGQRPVDDNMYNSGIKISHRPEISAVEWASGRQYVKVSDFDELMSGSRRPKPRKERKVFLEAEPNQPIRAKAPSDKRGWFEQSHPRSYASSMPTQTKTWGQTFEQYYDSAAEAVNGVMDDTVDNIKQTQKNTTRGIAKGLVAKKLGL